MMKKISLIAITAIALGCLSITTPVSAAPAAQRLIRIKNNYGAPVEVRVYPTYNQYNANLYTDAKPRTIPAEGQGMVIPDGGEIVLATYGQIDDANARVEIKTVGRVVSQLKGSSINTWINMIGKNPNNIDSGTITINKGTYTNPFWNISVSYL